MAIYIVRIMFCYLVLTLMLVLEDTPGTPRHILNRNIPLN
jgi:hypothetical protein